MMAKPIAITYDRSEQTTESPKRKLQTQQLILMHTRADRTIRSIIKRRLRSYDVGVMEWLALGVVRSQPRTGISLGRIAGTLNCSLPQINSITAKLVKRRLVNQKTGRQDHRVQQIIATAKGRALYAAAEQEINKDLEDWLSAIPENYFVFYKRVLGQMASTRQVS